MSYTRRRKSDRWQSRTIYASGFLVLIVLTAMFARFGILAAGADELPPEPIKTFGDEGEVCACYEEMAACVSFDSSQELGVALIELYLFGEADLKTEEATPCDEARCYGTPEEVKAACPAEHSGWVVANNPWPFVDDRPLYACDLQCVAMRKRGKEIGRTGKEGEAECEGPLAPAWESGKSQWQYTSHDGKRGVSLCVQSE